MVKTTGRTFEGKQIDSPADETCKDNRTSVASVLAECGVHSQSHTCGAPSTVCMTDLQDSQWRCRCSAGYIRRGLECQPVPLRLLDIEEDEILRREVVNVNSTSQIVIYLPFTQSEFLDSTSNTCYLSEENVTCNLNDSGIIVIMDNPSSAYTYHKVSMTISAVEDFTNVVDSRTLKIFALGQIISTFGVVSTDAAVGQLITQISVSSPYNLTLNSDYFKIDRNGNIHLARNMENYLDPSILSQLVTIEAMLTGGSTKVADIQILVYRSNFDVSVPENTIQSIVQIGASDNFSYEMRCPISAICDIFKIRENEVKIVEEQDYEDNEYNRSFDFIVVFYRQNVEIAGTIVKVSITDENDNGPIFPMESNDIVVPLSVKETFIMNLHAEDVDSVGTLTYSLPPGNVKFRIRRDSQLWITSALNSSDVTVSVTDGVNIPDTMNVYVTVEEYEEENLNKMYNKTMDEEIPSGYVVADVSEPQFDDYQFNEQKAYEYFRLGQTGIITTAISIDRDDDSYITAENNVLSFTIRANRKGFSCSFVILGRLSVTILDINDNPPVPQTSSFNGTIAEESAINTDVQFRTKPFIEDKDLNTRLTYTLSNSLFTIESDPLDVHSFVLKSTSRIDREAIPFSIIELSPEVSDGTNSATMTVFVNVLDINDNSPEYQGGNYSFSIIENSRVHTIVTQLDYTDKDQGDNSKLSFSMDSSYFYVDGNGFIKVDLPPDRETAESHNITIVVCDGGEPTNCTHDEFTINIIDENDNSPMFEAPSNVIFLEEAVSCDQSNEIVRVAFSDSDFDDNGRINYEVIKPNETFIIHATSGSMYCTGGLDYDALDEPRYEVEVKACDHGENPKCSEAIVYIEITDVNDNAPVFVGEYKPGSIDIPINEAYFSAVTPLSLVSATDLDSGINGQLSFTLSLPNNFDVLTINPENGLISTKVIPESSRPQANVGVIYKATVTVSDNGSPSLSSSANLTFSVIAVSDNFSFSDTDFHRSIAEGTVNEHDIILMSEYFNGNTDVKYDIPGITWYETFSLSINESTGSVTLTGEVDRENMKWFIFPVRAKWGIGGAAIAIVNISIVDINDNPPKFLPGRSAFRLFENETSGLLIGTRLATDKDEGQNAQTAYSLRAMVGSPSYCTTAFKINDTSGEISLTTSIDFDNLHNSKMDTFCKLTIEAIDVENPSFKDTVDITIEVLDVNDNPPEFLGSTFDVNIQEDTTVIDETMLPLTIDDKDRRQSANGHFDVVVENSDTCPFRAVGRRTTGNEQRLYFILQNNKQINHESTKSYSCNIRATDKGSPSQSASASVTVNVVDVNDNPPIVEDGNYAFNISRFSERGYVVLAQINATDIDSGQNGEIEFIKDTYLSSETAWDFFSLSDTTGLVTLDRSLTVLQLDIVALRVIVQDKGSPALSTSLEITLTIQDTNVRPYFLVKTKTVHLTEETRYQDTPLYTPPIPAYDQGSEETICKCLYRLGTPSDIFEIDSKTASIRLRNNTTIDREEIQALELLVIGEDDGIPPQDNSHDPLVIKVIILDINDMGPRFTQLQYNTTIFQGYPLNTPILTVEANDGDENPITIYEIISFNISIDLAGNHTTSMVAINQTSGELFLTASIDVNSTINFEIEVAVRASDGERPAFRDEAVVIITVQYDDPNKHFPRFARALYTKEASKDEIQPGDLLLTVDATDDDIGMNGKITYTLLNGNIRDTFAVNSSTGEVSLRYLFDDRTNVAYGSDIIVLTIMAIDGGIIPKIGFTNVTIVLSGSPPPCSGLTSEQVGEDDTTENNDVTYIVTLFALITVASLLMISNTIFIVLYCKQQSVPDVDNTSTRSNLRFEIGKRFHSNSFSYSSNSQPAFPYSVAYMGNYGEDYGSRQPYSLLAKDFQQERFDEPDYNIPHRHVASFQTSDQRGPPNYVPRRNIVYRSASDPTGWANRPYSTEFPALPEPNVDYPVEDNSPQLPPRRSTSRGLRRTEVSNDREYGRRRVAHLYPSVPLYGSII